MDKWAETADDLLAHGKAMIDRKAFVAAIPYLERATQLDASKFEAWAHLGWAYSETNQYGEALIVLDRALALNNGKGWVWNLKGVGAQRTEALRGGSIGS